MAVAEMTTGGAIVVAWASRRLRQELGPLAWAVLEELALEAIVEDGRLVAHTSTRQISEALAINPGTAASAVRVLRERGLVGMEQAAGPAGRFGAASYVLGRLEGLAVITPHAEGAAPELPGTLRPAAGQPCALEPDTVGCARIEPESSPAVARSGRSTGPRGLGDERSRRIPPPPGSEQGAFELEFGTPAP